MKRCLSAALATIMISLGMVAIAPSPAQAWTSPAGCGGRSIWYATLHAYPFMAHSVDITGGVCTNGTYLFKSVTPKISLPSTVPLAGTIENLDVTSGPYVSYIRGTGNKVQQVNFRFDIKQCTPVWPACQTFAFVYKTYPLGAYFCFVGGKCSDIQRW